ncbi:MAG TPA: MmgE/PrpD family protein [Devosia sp.]|nr:MmgE/PrpD family protein [Devosia sp.]
MTGLTEALAMFVVESYEAAIPVAARENAVKGITDTLAVILAGAWSEAAAPMLAYIDSDGVVPIVGTNRRTTPELAALANGTFGHALDFDDVLTMMPAHPSVVIVSALLAGRPEATSGRDFVTAYSIGIEVGARVGLGIGLGHTHRGFHGTGTLTIFSAAAALARLHRLTITQTRNLLGLCTSMASGVQRNFGTLTKPLHAGLAASHALAALRMTRAGITAAPDGLEGPAGFFAAYGVDASDPHKAAAALGNPWVLVEPGLALKKFACTYSAHRGMDALMQLQARHVFVADDVERLDCLMPPGGMRVLTFPRPTNGHEARFSMEYALAAGLRDGGYSLATFDDARVTRPDLIPLFERIHVREDQSCRGNDPDFEHQSQGARGFVIVRVVLGNGVSFSHRVDVPPGHPKRPLTWDDLACKFDDCATPVLPDRHRNRALALLQQLDTVENMAELEELLLC